MTTFTVAIPTHDRRETAVLAALSALRQTRPAVEVIVLCDGCTDGTAEAIREVGDPRLDAIELPKAAGYAYGHRNVALERAKGTAIVWLGDDDLLLPDHLERIGARWDEGGVDIVTSAAAVVHPDDRMEWAGKDWSVARSRRKLFDRCPNVMASVSIDVRLAREAGGWDASIPRGGDWDLWKRAIASGGRAASIDEITVLHFRGTGRVQPWPERVRQNTTWLERIGDPEELVALRRRFAGLRMQQGATVLNMLDDCERQLAHIRSTRWWRLRVAAAKVLGR